MKRIITWILVADGSQARLFCYDGPDRSEVEKRRFGHTLAAMLEDGLNQGRFDRLVLVAPPRALGQLRDELSKSARDKVSAELTKDLTQTPLHELPEHLGGIMAV